MTKFQSVHIRCDRCGHEADAEGHFMPERWATLIPPDARDGGVDLCPACFTAFEAWFAKPGEVKATTGEHKP